MMNLQRWKSPRKKRLDVRHGAGALAVAAVTKKVEETEAQWGPKLRTLQQQTAEAEQAEHTEAARLRGESAPTSPSTVTIIAPGKRDPG